MERRGREGDGYSRGRGRHDTGSTKGLKQRLKGRSRSRSPPPTKAHRYQLRRYALPPQIPTRNVKGPRVYYRKSRSSSRTRTKSGSKRNGYSRRRTNHRRYRSKRSSSRTRSRSRSEVSRVRTYSRSRSRSRTRRNRPGTRSRTGSYRHPRRREGSYRGRFTHTGSHSASYRKSWRSDHSHHSYHSGRPPRYPAKEEKSKIEKDASDDSTGHDDTIGSYEGRPGDYIASRYKIIREAGLGTFGRVLECLDKQRDEVVAIKVVRKVEKYTDSAKIEAAILEDVNQKDAHNTSLCVRMYKWFEYRGHVCLVFERLGCSLYEYLKNHDYKPFPIRSIRAYAWQLLTSLRYIHSIRLIHTDLKPENILLVDDEEERASSNSSSPSSSVASVSPYGSPRRKRQRERTLSLSFSQSSLETGDGHRETLRPPACNAVKLIDFGGATYDDESKSSIINTRQYRSPEVILGLGWSYPSDIWSAGCIIAELYIGELLFATHENMEHLALITKCIGKLPTHMIDRADTHCDKFFRRGRLAWPENASSDESVDHVRRMKKLEDILAPEDAATGLLDLLQLMLVLDPENRITAREALNHPFFDGFSVKDILPNKK